MFCVRIEQLVAALAMAQTLPPSRALGRAMRPESPLTTRNPSSRSASARAGVELPMYRRVLGAALLLVLALSGTASANNTCRCVPDIVLPGGNLAKLRDVATGGKVSAVPVTVAVRLKPVDVSPGSCKGGLTSDPVSVHLSLVDDDGDVVIDRSKGGFVCTGGKKTHAKFVTYFEGPKNCKNSAVPVVQSNGSITGLASTDDGSLNVSRKITCAAALPVEFDFSPPPNYHVTQGQTLNFSVTATRGRDPVSVSISGQPASSSFDGTNFSWVGGFVDSADTGNYNVTFTADGESTVVNIATTEYPVVGAIMVGLNGQPLSSLPVPVGGQSLLIVQPQFNNGLGIPSIGGRGSSGWSKFVWAVDATYLANVVSATKVAVVAGEGGGTTEIHASFTDAAIGEVVATTELDVLEVTSVAVSPANVTLPDESTEPLLATATLEDGSQSTRIPFLWQTSDAAVATVVAGSAPGSANMTAQGLGTATITAVTTTGPVVAGDALATVVSPLRSVDLFGMNQQASGNQVVTIDTAGIAQLHAAVLPPYDDEFGSSSSHDTNELMISGFQSSTGFSEIQRIDPVGNASAVFTSTDVTSLGDTIDVQAIRYRPDGQAYFAMSEGQYTLGLIDQLGVLSKLGGPSGNDGFGPISIAPAQNGIPLAYSGPWGVELLGQGNEVQGFADLVARYVPGPPSSNVFMAVSGVSQPQIVAPHGELWILDVATGELFRFDDLNSDGNYYEIETTVIMGQTIQTALDDPGERILAGQLPLGFSRLRIDFATQDIIATRVVGTAPQRITMMRVADLNSDGDVDDPGEQTIVFDAGAPAASDIRDVLPVN